MEQNYNVNDWTEPCPKYDCRKAACKCGLKYVNIPMSLGDDSAESSVAPKNGAYCNALVVYEANGHVYIYSQEGVPTLIDVDASDISTLEQEVIKAQKDVHELREEIKSLNDVYIFKFDTVAQMKSSTDLGNGSYAKTAGFRSLNDGGGALYKITNTGTANEMDVIAVDHDLYATLVDEKEVKIKQFGAYGDATHDDTAVLQRAIDYTSAKKGSLLITDGTYMVDALTNLFLKSDVKLTFLNAKIKAIATDQTTYNVLSIIDCTNCVINDAVIEGERDEHVGSTGEFGYGVNIRGESSDIVFNNLTVSNCWGDGIFFARKMVGSTDYIPEGIYFNGTTKITNCRRQGVSVIAGQSIYFDTLKVKKIDGTDPMAGIDIESEHSVDLIGNIYINLLQCNQTKKGFTMRARGPITGDIHVGTVIHENPVGFEVSGVTGTGYDPSFRVMYEYFNTDQAKYSVSVDKVYSEHGALQLENLYNDVTPKTIIGDVRTKEKLNFYAENPASGRSVININYPLTTELSNSLGNLIINSVIVNKVSVVESGATLNDYNVLKIYYSGNTALSSLKFENVRIGNIEAITAGTGVNISNANSNVLFDNTTFKSGNIKDEYDRRDSGTYTSYTSGGNTIYFMPESDATASKTLRLRVRNSLQPMKIKCIGNSTINIDTTQQSTQFTGVTLNGTALTGVGGVYSVGTYADGGEFNIYTSNGVIYMEQIS